MAAYWVLLSRTLGLRVLGDFAFANAVAVPIAVVLDAGFGQYLIREYRTGATSGLPHSIRPMIRQRYVLIGLSVVLVAAIVALLGQTRWHMFIGLFVALSYGLDAVALVWLTPARANLNVRPYNLLRLTESAGLTAATGLLWLVGPYDALSVSALSAVIYLVAVLPAATVWMRAPRWVAELRGEKDVPPSGRRHFAAYAFFSTAYTRIDQILIQVLLGSAALAPYALAVKLVEAAKVVPGAVARAVLAGATRGIGGDGETVGQRAVPRAIGVSVRVCFLIAVGLILTGPTISRAAFGSHYARASLAPLRVLACALPSLGFTVTFSSLLLSWGRERVAATNALISLGVTVGAALPLAVTLGPVGVAGGALIGEGASLVQYVHDFQPYGRLRTLLVRADLGLLSLLLIATGVVVGVPAFSVVSAGAGIMLSALMAVLIANSYRSPPLKGPRRIRSSLMRFRNREGDQQPLVSRKMLKSCRFRMSTGTSATFWKHITPRGLASAVSEHAQAE